jgi:thioredoxin 1
MNLVRIAAPGVAQDASKTVACLCAAWCDTCTAYRPVMERFAQEHADAHFVWLDIEDQESLLGTLEVENFPTLLIAVGDQVRFYGALTPMPETLARMLRACFDEAGAPAAPDADASALLDRLRG